MAYQHRFGQTERSGKIGGKIGIFPRIPRLRRLFGPAEARQIGSDHPAVGGQMVDNQAVRLRRRTPAVQQKHRRSVSLVDIVDVAPVHADIHPLPASFPKNR